eukprot:TRINITY_DN8223_c0_g1_i2.p1 TRINITY_DN8223_c0_g1~~TRINITY_DN8223_c0_g1_i2.p1  ORF type:complete len:407 (+),score=59.29 TRINITY_DN8223_c0_g1_i2:151-1371(+)
MEHNEEIKIAIVGCGIGGLALAAALHKKKAFHNIQWTIYERDESFDSRPQGYSLTIQQGIKVLAKLGLDRKVRETKCRNTAFETLRWDGVTLACFEGAKKNTYFSNVPIPRQELRRMMLEQIPQENIKWGKRCVSLVELEDSVQITFGDGEKVTVDAVVGCDGIRSAVRDQLIGDEMNFLGVIAVNGICPLNASQRELCNNRIFQTLDGNARLFVKPFAEGTWMWQLTVPKSEEEAKELLKAFERGGSELVFDFCRLVMKNWHQPIPTMIANTPADTLRVRILYDRQVPETKPWKTGRVTLLGDAAHPMSPFKGQGANSALEDSWSLFKYLTQSSSILQAFSRFETDMWNRTRHRVVKSRRGVTFLHTPNATDKSKLFQFLQLQGKQAEDMEKLVHKRNELHINKT